MAWQFRRLAGRSWRPGLTRGVEAAGVFASRLPETPALLGSRPGLRLRSQRLGVLRSPPAPTPLPPFSFKGARDRLHETVPHLEIRDRGSCRRVATRGDWQALAVRTRPSRGA